MILKLVCRGFNFQYSRRGIRCEEYYPTTMHYGRSTSPELQPFKYGGKELITMHGVDAYDFSSRMLSPMLMRFMSIDPLCERYYSISPYAYCSNNPVRFIDPTGEYIESAWDIASLAMGGQKLRQ